MRRLLPLPAQDLDARETSELTRVAFAIVTTEERPKPPKRPWVVINMVASADGHVVANDGRSHPLSGPADRAMFRALRADADVVLAGATTVRVENYGASRLPDELQAARVDAGRSPLPRLAVASRSLHLDPQAKVFQDAPPDQPTIVLTSTRAKETRPGAGALAPVATLLEAGEVSVDWPVALGLLETELGTQVLLVEGGPNVNGQLIAADLVDELCVTISPIVVGGSTPPVTTGGLMDKGPNGFELARVIEDDGFLLLRYLRQR